MKRILLEGLNGDAGNKNYYKYSNNAEEAIINTLNDIFGDVFEHVRTNYISHGDMLYNGELGDIKLSKSKALRVELFQNKRGKKVDGWFIHYLEKNMKWIMFINKGESTFKGPKRIVFKVRLVKFVDLAEIINKRLDLIGGRGELPDSYRLSPKEFKDDGFIGSFEIDKNGCLDLTQFHKFPNAAV